MPSTASAATARNSLCQFCIDWNQNSELVTKPHSDTAACPCSSCCWLYSAWPPRAWSANESANSPNRASESECSYTVSASPPRRTGPGASGLSRSWRGSASASSPSGFLDPARSEQGERERVLLHRQREPAATHRAGRLGVVALLARVGVGLVAVRLLGLRRALLDQPRGEQHVDAHLEELALPVLEGRLDERAAGQVLGVGLRWLAVLLVVAVVGGVAGGARGDQEDQEQAEHGDGQGVVTKHTAHASLLGWWPWGYPASGERERRPGRAPPPAA